MRLSNIFLILLCMITFMGCSNMEYSKTPYEKLLTQKYSISKINEIKNTSDLSQVTFSEFKKEFEIQCIRKTHQGYYVVLLLENDKNAFVFFNKENVITHIMVLKNFMKKTEFQNQVSLQMPISTVQCIDANSFFFPISSELITAHIVQEGVFILRYSRLVCGKPVDDPLVSSIEFIDNKSLLNNDSSIWKMIPYVFEYDKK